jgi:hypothetical protein
MSCPPVSVIQSNECIGNSLAGINDNFASLSNGICDNINRITDIESDITNLTTRLNALSSLVAPGAAKAWVVFDATKDSDGVISSSGNNRLIRSSYNVSSVLKYSASSGSPGLFEITFTTPFANNNYGVIATCSEKAAISGNFVWAQPSLRDSSFIQLYIRSIGASDIADPDYVSVIVI